jgi:hypothetical protein
MSEPVWIEDELLLATSVREHNDALSERVYVRF